MTRVNYSWTVRCSAVKYFIGERQDVDSKTPGWENTGRHGQVLLERARPVSTGIEHRSFRAPSVFARDPRGATMQESSIEPGPGVPLLCHCGPRRASSHTIRLFHKISLTKSARLSPALPPAIAN